MWSFVLHRFAVDCTCTVPQEVIIKYIFGSGTVLWRQVQWLRHNGTTTYAAQNKTLLHNSQANNACEMVKSVPLHVRSNTLKLILQSLYKIIKCRTFLEKEVYFRILKFFNSFY